MIDHSLRIHPDSRAHGKGVPEYQISAVEDIALAVYICCVFGIISGLSDPVPAGLILRVYAGSLVLRVLGWHDLPVFVRRKIFFQFLYLIYYYYFYN